jgi:hypothetical protein
MIRIVINIIIIITIIVLVNVKQKDDEEKAVLIDSLNYLVTNDCVTEIY